MPESRSNAVIRLRGVRHNNLKNFDLDLPLHRLIVITGLSGSGKSSLAFDTLYAEGQRRYIETFSPYARQFFDRMDKPQVDSIEGIPPAIAIEQRNTVRTTRSTVGTMTEICDHMKVLWPHLAQLHCRGCGQPVRKDSPQSVWGTILKSEFRNSKSELLITFDVPLSEKLPLAESLALVAKQGYQRLLLNGNLIRLEDALNHSALRSPCSMLAVVQDRLKLTPAARPRFVEACEQAYHFGKGKLAIWEIHPPSSILHPRLFSNLLHCAHCNVEYPDPSPALFSFNHPAGACPACKGFGRTITIDYDLALPDRSLTLAQGAVKPWRTGFSAECQSDLRKFCKAREVPMDVPFRQLSAEHQRWIIEGDKDYGIDEEHEWPRAWYGVKGYFRWLESKSYKMHVRVLLSRYRAYAKCPDCQGARLKPEAMLYLLRMEESGLNRGRDTGVRPPFSRLTLPDFYALPVRDALALIDSLEHSRLRVRGPRQQPSDPITHALSEVRARLGYLDEVGLGYLTLDRPTRTLSGGETERVNLTTCLGTRLVNTLFVLDEPSVGLHPRDTDRLVRILEKLRDTGNTVVVVEHEASVIRAADQIVDIGPGHGATGGEVVFQGPLSELLKSPRSLTGQYLSGRQRIQLPKRRPVADDLRRRNRATTQSEIRLLTAAATLRIENATRHNLNNVSVAIPLNRLVAITGVSGSGKSTLVRDVLLPALSERLKGATVTRRPTDLESDDSSTDENSSRLTHHPSRITGYESLGQVVLVDQSALGKTPRSNPAVYIGAFDDIREVFAQSEVAKQRGLNASAFSFNSAAGQCEKCRGAGFEKIEMQFLSDIFIRCPDCNGRRYRQHILEVKISSQRGNEVEVTKSVPNRLLTSAATIEWSIGDLLEATVDEVIEFLSGFTDSNSALRAVASLKLLQEVGLGYLRLGQPINTLSGGESQRLKLVRHLAEVTQCPVTADVGPLTSNSRPSQSRLTSAATLFLFDEPTTGLHFDDVRVLLQVFQRLVDAGHSVIVIEHNLDVIKCADWVIDLGPEAGDGGGKIVACGTPEEVAACPASHTGSFLQAVFRDEEHRKKAEGRRPPTRTKPIPSSILRSPSAIAISGAREHNLKNLSLEVPRDRFVVITGVSGSGKSTLAFDLLFNEGQRRFLDSMNLYARQFVEQMARPDVDLITGIPPTVSIEQRTTRGGGKSTVATVTEIYHFIRLLFARLGTQYCPDCQLPVEPQTRDELARHLQAELKRRGDLLLLAPVVKNRKGFHSDVAEWAFKSGYKEIRADGKMYDTSKPFRLDRFKEHDVEIVVGVAQSGRARSPLRAATATGTAGAHRVTRPTSLTEIVDTALKLGNGTLYALDHRRQLSVHSTERACPGCGKSFAPLDPKNFSYNSAQGWCPKCRGFGELFYLPDVERGANADSIEESWWGWAQEREVCPECHGARLNPVARAVRLNAGHTPRPSPASAKGVRARRDACPTINAFSALDVEAALAFVRQLKFTGRAADIARDILPEIRERLKFLNEVGLGYLQLGRGMPTLSGGEAQRIRLAAQLGSNLSGVLYVLDEPTIGLHARDNEQLLDVLQKLRRRGNSVVVVEHDEDTMRRADHVIDLGPGAGVHGGQVVASGTLAELAKHPESVTGQCLRTEKKFPARGERRVSAVAAEVRRRKVTSTKPADHVLTSAATHGRLTLRGAALNNLKNLTVTFPLGRLVLVTGVSGSGKSTLVRECLLPELQAALKAGRASARAAASKPPQGSRGRSLHLSGFESLKAVYEVDQSPIGRTPRSIPATYVGFFDDIRALFAQVPEARMRGYSASRFSFNSAQGRCPECEGAGQIKLEMNFLPPAFVRCETCEGTRFNRETLDIAYGGKNIAQVLDLSVEEALAFFASVPKIKRALEALHDTGLDYLKLGQQSPTLSGGEAQRVKLVTHLLTGLKPAPAASLTPHAARNTNLFILEEPTIGLHIADVRRLVEVLQRLVDAGHSVIVIEHNLDLIAEADWVIDLGPEGGEGGGRMVAEGTPEQIARNQHSHTGRFLRRLLHLP
ncbi:MAG: excinuclease ABC subunit UvrA [Verrucomicrobiae bacterium]|nr:excinuclease ABC subunit UvrA [Verrucomicrobiae bacterium]